MMNVSRRQSAWANRIQQFLASTHLTRFWNQPTDTAPKTAGGVSTVSENGNRRQRTEDRGQRTFETPEQRTEDGNIRSPTCLRLVTAID